MIVDLQNKNENFKIRLEAMESGVVNGDSSQAMEIAYVIYFVQIRMNSEECLFLGGVGGKEQ